MQPEQQRIMVYFIEEAKEHLVTIEHGLLNLQTVVEDPEVVNEVFRAAHSIKGGAAMLGIHSIQHVAHRLEDYFKVLKEHPIQVDQQLESLFLRGFDALSALTLELESSFSLPEDMAQTVLQEVEPVFTDLNSHLSGLTGATFELEAPAMPELATATAASSAPATLDPARLAIFRRDVLQQLQQILRLFQESDQATYRPQIAEMCQDLAQLGREFSLSNWSELLEITQVAIAHPENSFAKLAPIVVTTLKEARDLVLAQQDAEIIPPETLLALCPISAATNGSQPEEVDWLGLFDDDPASETSQSQNQLDDLLDDLLEDPAPVAAPEPEEVAEPLLTPEPEPDFAALTALLEEDPIPEAPIAETVVPEVTAGASAETDFADLEKLLDATHKSSDQPAKANLQSATAPPPSRSVRRTGNIAQTMKVPVKQLDNLSNLVGELIVNRNTLEDGQNRLRQFLDNMLSQVQQLNDLGQKMQDLYERSLLESSLLSSALTPQAVGSGSAASNGSEEQHATGANFDALEMDSFTDFHRISQEMIERIVRVREAASDIEFVVDSSEQVSRRFRQSTTQLQEGLTRSRMIPFGQVAERLPRAVRDISLKCGKQATLDLEGRETLVDKSILERLYDPLTHLVNNAIYHGIEASEVRQSRGKPAEGTIKIQAFYQGNQTVISIADDGGGIDLDRIKTKAIQKGLITADQAAALPRQEAYSLLFQPGFSTNDQADDLAGRGVGMDVVRSSIHDIRGVINTDSVIGKGTTFTIRLPLTLSITKALCCTDREQRIAFPIDGVEDVFDVSPAELLQTAEGDPIVLWQNQQLLCKPLSELLSYNRLLKRSSAYNSNQSKDTVSIIVLRSNTDKIAIQVDEVLGEQEIVIKQLSGPVPKPIGVAGVTVLGDGRVMPIADVLELVDLSLGRLEVGSNLWENMLDVPLVEEQSEPTVLIVDDSITVRELLSSTFKKVGYRVEQARDGLEAWEMLRSGLPCDLIFCDVEMPRMDGLEFLSRVQDDPDLQDLPVAMLTSRGAARHKQMAADLGAKGYFTKPYLEEALLDGAQRMINGEVLVK